MVAGHFGFAAAVKAKAPSAPLWALMLATVWLDIVFVPLYAAGIESLQPIAGGGYGEVIIHADYTHSLLGAGVLALLFGLVAAVPWGRRVGMVLGAVVFSHWLLDLIVHRADLPILPGNAGELPRLGFGLCPPRRSQSSWHWSSRDRCSISTRHETPCGEHAPTNAGPGCSPRWSLRPGL